MPILNVIDLEMNQPSGKIIQIGGAQLDTETGKIAARLTIFVDPKEPIAERIVELCNISDGLVDLNGRTLDEAATMLFDWMHGKRLAAWGGDVPYLKQRLTDEGIQYPKGLSNLDLSSAWEVFHLTLPGKKKRGLVNAVEKLDMKFIGRQHHAMYDAWNAARVAQKMFKMTRQIHQIRSVMEQ